MVFIMFGPIHWGNASSTSLSLSLSFSFPPSLPLFLSPSLSQHPGDVIGYLVRHGSPGSTRSVPADAVAACRTDSDPKSIGQPFSSPKPYDHHKHSTSPCKYMLDIKVRSECKRGRYWTEQARDCERLIRCETRCTFTSISHGTAKQLVQCKSPRARRRAGGIAIPNGKCRGSGILRLSSAEAALPIPDSG